MNNVFTPDRFSPWTTAALLAITGFLGFAFIGPTIGMIAAIPFIRGTFLGFIGAMYNPVEHPDMKTPFLVLQDCATFFGLVIVPALYWRTIENKHPLDLFRGKKIPAILYLLAALIVISSLPFLSAVIEWNANVRFPDFLGGFHQWAVTLEKKNQELVELITTYDSFGQFLFSFFTISILAGFCEEFFFRGLMQPVLKTATGNIHVAIWLTAILFSGIHFEFFGFVPRMLLGALFGYIYYWSGNLMLPVIGHMVNNGVSVVVTYVMKKGTPDFDINSPEAVPVPFIIIGTGIFITFLYYFHRLSMAKISGAS